MSLDAVHVDLSKSFEPGMGYVALSRVRTLDGLVISGINTTALAVHPEILEIDAQFRQESEDVEKNFSSLSNEEILAQQKVFLDKNTPKEKEKKVSTYEKTLELIEQKKRLDEIARVRGLTTETIIEHLETLVSDGENIDIAYLKREISPAHFQKIAKAFQGVFEKTNEAKLSPVKEIVGPNISYKEIRLARLLLGYFK